MNVQLNPVVPEGPRRLTVLLVGICLGLLTAGVVVPLFAPAEPEVVVLEAPLAGTSAGSAPGGQVSPQGGGGSVTPDGTAPGTTGGQTGQPGQPSSSSQVATGAGGSTVSAGSAGQPVAPGGAAPSGAEAGNGTVVREASDIGVTAESIKLGFAILDTAGLEGSDAYEYDAQKFEDAFLAYVQEVNDKGGINGRMIDPVTRRFTPLDPDSTRQACLELTEDEKVFGIIAGETFDPALLCVAEEHQTPLMPMYGVPAEFHVRAKGLLATVDSNSTRMMWNWVDKLHTSGELPGKTIGIFTHETDFFTSPVDKGLIPALEHYGYEVAHISRFSNDPGVSAGQAPGEVFAMQSALVDGIMVVSDIFRLLQFVQEADSINYTPHYFAQPAGGIPNADISGQLLPESWEATAVLDLRFNDWKYGIPATEYMTDCLDRYEKHTGQRPAPPPENTGDQFYVDEPALIGDICQTFDAFVDGLRGAGANPTRSSWSSAIQADTSVAAATVGPGAFGPGKFDASNQVRITKWDRAGCNCWNLHQDFTEVVWR